MRIRELRAEARNALKGNLMKVALPLAGILIFNFLLGFGFEMLASKIFRFNATELAIASVIFYIVVILFSTILQFGIIKRIIKVSRNEESNFIKDTFSKESVKASFSVLWGLIKKYAIWIVLLVVSVGLMASANSSYALVEPMISAAEPHDMSNMIYSAVASFIASIIYIIALIMIIITSYRYMLVYYLKHDYPDKPTKELFEKSRMMMRGNKAKALVIPITMIGWALLLMLVAVLLLVLLELIWPSEAYYFTTISTVPVWATILFTCLIYFLASLLTSYINMTYYQLYMEQKPLELYNDDYLKPETNAKKYIWIVVAIIAVYFLIVFGSAAIISWTSYSLINSI